MRFDVRRAIREDDERRDREQRDAVVRSIVDLETEATVLANMLGDARFCDCRDVRCCNPLAFPEERALAFCDDVEMDDFTDFRYRAALQALRNLQASGFVAEPCAWPCEVADEIERTDRRQERHVAMTVDAVFLTELVLTRPRLGRMALGRATTRLRELANHRRLA